MNLKNGMKVFADCETISEMFTINKHYEIVATNGGVLFAIINDAGQKIACKIKDCAFLKGGNWQIVKTEPKRHFFQVQAKTLQRKELITEHRKNNTNYTSDSAYILALIDADIEKFKNK